MDNSALKTPNLLDKAAVALSGLCLLHCLALPALLAIVPLFNELSTEHLHAEMLLVVLPVSVFALLWGYRRHRNGLVMAIGASGLVILTIGGTYAHSRYGLSADRALTIAGSLVLAIAHFRNSRLSRHAAATPHGPGFRRGSS